jgi:hypothetical protein
MSDPSVADSDSRGRWVWLRPEVELTKEFDHHRLKFGDILGWGESGLGERDHGVTSDLTGEMQKHATTTAHPPDRPPPCPQFFHPRANMNPTPLPTNSDAAGVVADDDSTGIGLPRNLIDESSLEADQGVESELSEQVRAQPPAGDVGNRMGQSAGRHRSSFSMNPGRPSRSRGSGPAERTPPREEEGRKSDLLLLLPSQGRGLGG